MSKARIVWGNQMILISQFRFQQRLIHPGRGRQPVQEQNRRSIFWPGLSIENIDVIDSNCAVGNFSESVCDIHNEGDSSKNYRCPFHMISKMTSTTAGVPIGRL